MSEENDVRITTHNCSRPRNVLPQHYRANVGGLFEILQVVVPSSKDGGLEMVGLLVVDAIEKIQRASFLVDRDPILFPAAPHALDILEQLFEDDIVCWSEASRIGGCLQS